MLKPQGLALTSAVLFTLFSSASSAEFRRSEIQETENNVYIAIGGGGGGLNTSTWNNAYGDEDLDASETSLIQPDHKTVGTANGMLALGYTFPGAPLRLEAAYNYIGNGKFEWKNLVREGGPIIPPGSDITADTRVFSNTLMLNAYLDFIVNEKWMPFVMMGGGYGINSAKLEYEATIINIVDPEVPIVFNETSDRKNKSNFVWNVGLGVNYGLSENWTVGIAATYFYLGKMDVNVVDPLLEEDFSLFKVDRLDAFIATANLAYHF